MMRNLQVEVTPAFKAQALRAIFSIGFFALTYFILFVLALGLTALCVVLGLALMLYYFNLITVCLGIGLASLGFMILIFLVKFMFKSHKVDSSHLMEIHSKDEPKLFEMIKEIVEKVDTRFPKKVYLSSEVNASVFYDSSFWSMFLPVRKNLVIGMGLVNVVTESELKAILAHEFGHFSQRTMKVGSYVYNVNQVIYNLLNENESFEQLIGKWAEISGYFAIFVVLAAKIVSGIQWVLRKLYALVNKQYMGLSREMEFHADEIAANVAGAEPLKSALLRISIADLALNKAIGFYESRISENIKSCNLYADQSVVLNLLSEENEIPLANGLPQITVTDVSKYDKSKLVIKDQWASHPSIQDRILRLDQYQVRETAEDTMPANLIFSNAAHLQQIVTDNLFKPIKYEGETINYSSADFRGVFEPELLDASYDKVYNGYYDHKDPIPFDREQAQAEEISNLQLAELFNEHKVDMVYTAISLKNDIDTLKQIALNKLPVKTFDYDGKKYARKESKALSKLLEASLKNLEAEIKLNDIKIYRFFETKATNTKEKETLANKYASFFIFDIEFENRYQLYTELATSLEFISVTTPIEQIRANFRNILPMEEKLKEELNRFMLDDSFKEDITTEMEEQLKKYCSQKWNYFGQETYFDQNLEVLYSALNLYLIILSSKYYRLKKELLLFQSSLLEPQVQKTN